MKPELLRANQSALDELPRSRLLWKWPEIVDCDGSDDGLDPSVAQRLLDAGHLRRDDVTGMWSVRARLWEYIESSDWLDVEGKRRGQTLLEEFGVAVPRDPPEQPEPYIDGIRPRSDSPETQQVALDLETDVEAAVRARRARRTGIVQKKLAAEKAVSTMSKWERASLDKRQVTIMRYRLDVGRLIQRLGNVYYSATTTSA